MKMTAVWLTDLSYRRDDGFDEMTEVGGDDVTSGDYLISIRGLGRDNLT